MRFAIVLSLYYLLQIWKPQYFIYQLLWVFCLRRWQLEIPTRRMDSLGVLFTTFFGNKIRQKYGVERLICLIFTDQLLYFV